jgi:formylglycine-generating enzyme
MRYFILLLILIITSLTSTVNARNLIVYDVDNSNYPIIKAKFFAFDNSGKQIYDLKPSNFTIIENSIKRNVISVTCPEPGPVQQISSVLTIDISASMKDGGIDIAKLAALTWFDFLPLGESECAITSFNKLNYLNQDFTTNKIKLIESINALTTFDGTDFNAAFVYPPAGALIIAEGGKYKKIIVFLTDGSSNCQTNTIINLANSMNCTIYCVIMNYTAKNDLKIISQMTGGLCIDQIKSQDDIYDAYRRILQTALGGKPCIVEWETEGCDSLINADISIPYPNGKTTVEYTVPDIFLPFIKYTPSNSISFGGVPPNTTYQKSINIYALNKTVTIEDIQWNNPYFSIKNFKKEKITLEPGDYRKFDIIYSPKDTSYQFAEFKIITNSCDNNFFYASGGGSWEFPVEQIINLIQPNGGEQLLVGSDTVITWGDVLPDEPVILEYSIDGGKSWRMITDTAKGLSYRWKVPKTPSNQCLARVTSRKKFCADDMILIDVNKFIMGDQTGNGETDERPIHDVTLTRQFYLSKYEITQSQWKAVMGFNPSQMRADTLPVINITWYDAVNFCNTLSDNEGLERCYSGAGSNISCNFDAKGYRLPTEAEWEYACRGGTTTDFYSGNMLFPLCSPLDDNLDMAAWYCGNSGNNIRAVGLKINNQKGLFDIHGNALEWCWDFYSNDYYKRSPAYNPTGDISGTFRTARGGWWKCNSITCRSSNREYYHPTYSSSFIGFRVAKTK